MSCVFQYIILYRFAPIEIIFDFIFQKIFYLLWYDCKNTIKEYNKLFTLFFITMVTTESNILILFTFYYYNQYPERKHIIFFLNFYRLTAVERLSPVTYLKKYCSKHLWSQLRYEGGHISSIHNIYLVAICLIVKMWSEMNFHLK